MGKNLLGAGENAVGPEWSRDWNDNSLVGTPCLVGAHLPRACKALVTGFSTLTICNSFHPLTSPFCFFQCKHEQTHKKQAD